MPQPYIAAVTGHGEVEFRRRAEMAKVDEIVVKPATKQELSEVLRKMVERIRKTNDSQSLEVFAREPGESR